MLGPFRDAGSTFELILHAGRPTNALIQEYFKLHVLVHVQRLKLTLRPLPDMRRLRKEMGVLMDPALRLKIAEFLSRFFKTTPVFFGELD